MKSFTKLRQSAGLTLVEMMVTITMVSGVLAIATTGLIVVQRVAGDNAWRLDAVSQSKVAVEAMSRVVRTAILPKQAGATCDGCDVAAFISGDSTRMTFYANVDSSLVLPTSGITTAGPSLVTYQVSDGVVTETLRRPDPHAVTDFNYTYSCDPGSVAGCIAPRNRVLARELINTDVFTYYDSSGAVITPPLESATSKLKAVDSVDIKLLMQSSERVEPLTTVTRITLPNADSVIQATPNPSP